LNIGKAFIKDLFAGTAAGISSTIFGHPLDTIKVTALLFKEEYYRSECKWQRNQ